MLAQGMWMKFEYDGLFCSLKTIKNQERLMMIKKYFFLGAYIINLYIEPNAAYISSVHILLTSLWPIGEGQQYLYYSEETLSHTKSKRVL